MMDLGSEELGSFRGKHLPSCPETVEASQMSWSVLVICVSILSSFSRSSC